MNATEPFSLQAWKRQLEAGVRLAEELVEASTRLHEIQLEAAAEAHADLEATRKAIAAATDMTQLLKLQAEWAQANARRSAAYWSSVSRTVFEMTAALVKGAHSGPAVALPEPAVLGAVDNAYRQWLELTQRFYRPVERQAA